jgi:hypothetical protein
VQSEKEIIWTAGLLEGEGSFRNKTHGHVPIVECEMTDKDVIEKLQEIWGGKIYFYPARKSHYKDTWTWHISGEDAAQIMNTILPFMFERRSSKMQTVLFNWQKRKDTISSNEQNGLKAAEEYLLSSLSLRQVAKKYSISYETVRRNLKKVNNN